MPAGRSPRGPQPHARTDAPRTLSRVVALALVLLVGMAAVAGIVALGRRGTGNGDPGASTTAGRESDILTGVASGSQLSSDAAETGELRISRDFGAQTLLARELVIPPSATVMSVLSANAKVETAYGGGFVNAIDGLTSGFTAGGGQQADWFFYVNGMQADRGALDYALSGRDRVWWDYHRWDFTPIVPATVGQYPQPFLSGSDRDLPTVVQFADGFSEDADAIVEALEEQGVESVSAAPLGHASVTGAASHVVLVGTWRALSAAPAVTDAAKDPAASGLFARFGARGLETVDSLGNWRSQGARGGAVMATSGVQAPDAAIWLVTGVTTEDVRRAARLLHDGAPQLQGCFGVAVLADGSVLPLPEQARR